MVTSLADIDREVRELIVKHMREGSADARGDVTRGIARPASAVTDVSYNVWLAPILPAQESSPCSRTIRRERKGLGFDT